MRIMYGFLYDDVPLKAADLTLLASTACVGIDDQIILAGASSVAYGIEYPTLRRTFGLELADKYDRLGLEKKDRDVYAVYGNYGVMYPRNFPKGRLGLYCAKQRFWEYTTRESVEKTVVALKRLYDDFTIRRVCIELPQEYLKNEEAILNAFSRLPDVFEVWVYAAPPPVQTSLFD